MTDKPRRTGIDVIGDVPWGTHFCQFYNTKEDLTSILVPYFKKGLEDNEFCMWVTSEPLTVDEAKEALAQVVPDLDEYIRKGQIEFLAHTDWYLKGGSFESDRVLSGWVQRLEAARSGGYEGLRLTGNTFWLEKAHWGDFAAYEAVVNDVIGSYRMIAVCTYSLEKCGAMEIAEVISNHQFALLMREGEWQVIETSEYKQAKELLRKERDFVSAVLDTAGCLVVVLDRDGRIVRFNRACEETTGYSFDEVKGECFWEFLLPPDEVEPVKQTFADLCVGLPNRFEDYWVCRDGSRRLITWSNTVLLDPSGVVEHVIGTGIDVTQQRLAEQALRDSEERFRLLVQGVKDYAIFSLDADGRVATWNEGAERIKGYGKEEILGKHFSTFYPPEDVSAGKPKREIDLARKQGSFEDEGWRVRSDGSRFWASVTITALKDEAGWPHGFSKITRDMTDRKIAEEKLREAYERERRIAETLQRSLLSPTDMTIGGFNIAQRYKPALKEAEVGGDFYDVFAVGDGRFAFVIGDVSGKGIKAAVYTAMAKYILRAYAHLDPEPAQVLGRLNRALCAYAHDDVFVTIFYGLLNPVNGTLSYATAGHEPPLLYVNGQDGVVLLQGAGAAAGVIPEAEYEQHTMRLSPGDTVLMYTDGLTDATSNGQCFGLCGLSDVLVLHARADEGRIADAVYDAAVAFAGGELRDDAAILVLKAT